MLQASTRDAGADYQRREFRKLLAVAAVLLLVLVAFVTDLMTGPAGLTPREIISAILHPDAVDRSRQVIVWSFRLPTALLAIAVGAALGFAGCQMQTVLNNPLASPYTLGVSAAAAFGAALVIVCGVGRSGIAADLSISGGAFAAAVLCSLLLFLFCRGRGDSAATLLVGGVALHFLFSSGLALLQYLATNDALNAIVFWTFGSLQGATWPKLSILAVVLCGTMALTGPRIWQLTALQLGDESARSLGVDVDQLRFRTMLLVSVLTATAVCFTGSIGFVGLVAPHVARTLVGEDQRYFVFLSTGIGALLVSLAAVLCKTLVPGTVFPIGIVTAGIGAPVFAALAFWQRKGRE
ncbi:FecCD family ABC transporter permease [Planctomicrobium sp. SH664]|uniref:FecCD family ABC transporter permease n=1 Tax=Planctomicrobium sp. SH664 TaxID=3448125 RepID=UPI003F5B0CAE